MNAPVSAQQTKQGSRNIHKRLCSKTTHAALFGPVCTISKACQHNPPPTHSVAMPALGKGEAQFPNKQQTTPSIVEPTTTHASSYTQQLRYTVSILCVYWLTGLPHENNTGPKNLCHLVLHSRRRKDVFDLLSLVLRTLHRLQTLPLIRSRYNKSNNTNTNIVRLCNTAAQNNTEAILSFSFLKCKALREAQVKRNAKK